MSMVPYTLIDHTAGLMFPLVTQGFYYEPSYSAKATATGADAFLDDQLIARFDTMTAACEFVSDQSRRASKRTNP